MQNKISEKDKAHLKRFIIILPFIIILIISCYIGVGIKSWPTTCLFVVMLLLGFVFYTPRGSLYSGKSSKVKILLWSGMTALGTGIVLFVVRNEFIRWHIITGSILLGLFLLTAAVIIDNIEKK